MEFDICITELVIEFTRILQITIAVTKARVRASLSTTCAYVDSSSANKLQYDKSLHTLSVSRTGVESNLMYTLLSDRSHKIDTLSLSSSMGARMTRISQASGLARERRQHLCVILHELVKESTCGDM